MLHSIIKVLKKWIDDTFLGFHKDPCLVEIFRKWAETASNFSVKDKGWIDHLSQSLVLSSYLPLLTASLHSRITRRR
jgi:hypothetical protein